MQGQQDIGSFTETIDINNGSTSSTAVRPQICWSNVQNAGDNRLPNYIVAPGDIGVTYVNPTDQERQAVSRLSFGGPSSSSTQNDVSRDEQKIEHIWSSSSSSFARNHPSSEGQHSELISHFSLDNISSNPMITQGFNRSGATQNINLNADYMACGVDNFCPNICKSSGTENERMQIAGGPDPSSIPSGSGAYLEEENNRSLGFPLEGSRSSCKRKYPELSFGESSSSGSRRFLQHGETRPAVLADGRGSSLSSLPEQVNPRISVQSRGSAYNTIQNPSLAGQSSHRNIRMRMNPSSQPESGAPYMLPSGTAARPSSTLSSQQSLRTHPVGSLHWRTHTEPDVTVCHDHPAVIHIPPLPRNVQPLRWNGVSLSSLGSSSSSVISGNRDDPREESNLRISGRNLMSHPRLSSAAEIRNLVPSPTNSNLISGNLTTPGHIASSSGTSSSSAVPSSAPSWVPPSNPPSRYPRRLSEYVRRSLFSPVGPESGGQGSAYSPLGSASSAQDMLLPSGAGHQNHHQSNNARLIPWMGRQGDGAPVVPYPFRSSAASGEARRGRIVSEIRSVLDLMRRGEGLRLEDVMILDQSVFFNIADIHDRHRDMRLDVDNMSYEELLALEERIGNVSTGLNDETIISQLKLQKFSKLSNGQEDAEPCCICQEEYNDGDDIGKLECGHDFHRDCIKQWLTHKNLCPICKTKGLAT